MRTKTKTLCILLHEEDALPVRNYVDSHREGEDITVVAPTFDGRMAAMRHGLEYVTYEEEAWKMNYPELCDRGRELAFKWHHLPSIRSNPCVEEIRYFKSYPLLEMSQNSLYLELLEILPCCEYVGRVLEIENPEKVIVGESYDLLTADASRILECGVEKHMLKALAKNRGIELVEPAAPSENEKKRSLASWSRTYVFSAIGKCLNITIGILDRLFGKGNDEKELMSLPETFGRRVLVFGWGDYYLSQLSEMLFELVERQCQVTFVAIGGEIDENKKEEFRKKGVPIMRKSDWHVENEGAVVEEYKRKGRGAFEAIRNSEQLAEFFLGNYGSFYSELILPRLEKQLIDEIPATVAGLLRTEEITAAVEPDVVFNQFFLRASEALDVMPARAKGIPTVGCEHGCCGYTARERNIYTTEYFLTNGEISRDAMMQAFKPRRETVFAVGNSYYEDLRRMGKVSRGEAKIRHGFDPERPLIIFCDTSQWPESAEWRYSTSRFVESIIGLKKHLADLQIIHRVHYGMEYHGLQKYYEELNDPDVHIQNSMVVLLKDIVDAADLVISHNCSGISESLARGVPVIYWCALSEREPSYQGSYALTIVDNLDDLPAHVFGILARETDERLFDEGAQEFFDMALCGLDGNSNQRRCDVVIRLADREGIESNAGFEDWLARIKASCAFRSGTWEVAEAVRERITSAEKAVLC